MLTRAHLLALLVLSISFSSCFTSQRVANTAELPVSDIVGIPDRASEILVHGEDPDELFDSFVDLLIAEGHRVSSENAERRYILTEGTHVEPYLLLRLDIKILDDGTARLNSQWMYTGFTIEANPVWQISQKRYGMSAVAFAETYALTKKLGHPISFN